MNERPHGNPFFRRLYLLRFFASLVAAYDVVHFSEGSVFNDLTPRSLRLGSLRSRGK